MISDRPPLPDLVHSPQIQSHTVKQTQARHDGESPSAVETEVVAKIEQRSRYTAEDD